ncbi:MYB-like transcription factor ETC3 isoform X2 [Salvia splendens]|uniref:MYB-like transcription factor ETC3 isoform X2 n=1 Tax=Salvia splendens TaxID=180675 RepID=UPI001C2669B9|nr:MYB-like transcription factor ETC3 isoform X2 [Salvia splendens]
MAGDQLQKAETSDDTVTISSIEDLVAADENSISEAAKKLEISEDEETLIIRMFNLVGDKWSLIAGRIPGRSAEEIEKYWNSRHSTNQNK